MADGLSVQFSPRLANFGELRFYRIDCKANYGELNRIAKHHINLEKIRRHWDDLLRLCGSITLGVVRASDALRALQSGAYRSSISEALDELGRIAKTLYLLAYLDDPVYRRRILTQGNRHEGRHALMRGVSFARCGLLYQSLHDGMALQLASLSLVTNAIVLWNTWYMNLALEQLERDGVAVDPADVSRLSPLGYAHIRLYGRYRFVVDPHVARGGFRALGQGGSGDVLDED